MSWTAEDIERIIVKEDAPLYVKRCIQRADEWYMHHYEDVKQKFNMGIIGPDGQPKKFDRNAWILGEVRHRLLSILDEETPIKKEDNE